MNRSQPAPTRSGQLTTTKEFQLISRLEQDTETRRPPRSKNRKKTAASLLEMVAGLIVMLPILLTVVDLVLITIGAQVNDNCAREAVRMAASGDPIQANQRAVLVVDRLSKSSKGYLSKMSLMSLTFVPSNLLTTEASLTPYGGLVEGSVTVKTEVTVTPFLISFFHNGPMKFQSQQTCPVTYVVPNTAGGQPAAQ